MANIDATDLLTKIRYMGADGDANALKARVSVPSTAANGDVIRPLIIPAGSEVDLIVLSNAALYASGGNASVGYAPVSSSDGALAADSTYFSAGASLSAPFAAASNGQLINRFAPIKFEQDVYLTITLTSAPVTGATGNLEATVIGRAVGIK